MNQHKTSVIRGAGLGLRRAFIGPLCERTSNRPDSDFLAGIDFMEVAPENWISVGGRFGKQFRALTEVCPFVLHGLSLSLGSPAPLDLALVRNIKG
ncbi:MAG TPA: DUF692 family protein, partial [Candidatus Kapabacteria bacterium]|nr:DUF692 family protein [Candidatus Kapabacteria bacterium]